MGGGDTLRGLVRGRDRGGRRVLVNGELRWRGVRLSARQNMHLGAVAFADAGRILDGGAPAAPGRWRHGLGIGLRGRWQSTVVRADWGRADGAAGLYLTFGHMF